jgi:hypothetical protein
MRNTVHLVPAEDLRWMMRLVAPRIRMIIDSISRTMRLELDERVYAKSNAVIAAALAGGRQLARPALAEVLERAGIQTEGRLTLLTQRAQTDGVVCHGLRHGAHHGLVLVDDWLRAGRELDGEEAQAEFARRYFRSHGPATVADYAWWSGLTVRDAKRGIGALGPELARETVDGQEYWSAADAERPATDEPPAAHLLPNYDEFTVAYKDRSAVFDPMYRPKVDTPTHNILFANAIAIGGEILGTWKRSRKPGAVTVDAVLFRPPLPGESEAVTAAAERYGRFLELPVRLATSAS